MSTRRAFGALRRLPSKRYQASYLGPDGRRHLADSTFLVKADADRWLREEEILIDRAEWTPPATRRPVEQAPDRVTLKAYAEANITRRARRSRRPITPTTRDLYDKLLRLAILPGLGHLPIDEITPNHIRHWHDNLPPETPTQNGNAYTLLKSLLADAEDEELIDRNPCRIKGAGKPAPNRTGQSLTVGELAVYGMAVRERCLMPLLLAAWCGLRSGEVRGLRRCDISSDGTHIKVDQAVTRVGTGKQRTWRIAAPKTAAGRRTIAVPPHLVEALADWLAVWDSNNSDRQALLFPALDGVHPMSDSVLREAHKAGCEAIGRPEVTLHDLRRTGATLAAQASATVREVMRMLGHTTSTVAMLYQTALDARHDERAKRMSELLQ